MNNSAGPSAGPQTRSTKTWWVIVVAALVAFAICLLAVRFTVGGSGAVDAPTGLTTSASEKGVKIAWTGVSGADTYQVVRDDSVVVYDGDATTYVDAEATTGKHRYAVRAVADGVESAASAPSEATAGSSWGAYRSYISQFPDLLPQAPDLSGWKDLKCTWTLYGFKDEMGRAEDGSGKSLSRARIACGSPELALSMGWLQSKEATDSIFGRASRRPGIEAVKWRFGTGYYDSGGNTLHLRPDSHEKVWIGISANGATKGQLLDFANAMPLE